MSKRSLKNPLIVLGLIIALVGGYLLGRGHDEHPGQTTEAVGGADVKTAAAKVQYTCGMHPFIIQDEPGTCPICGMNLTPLKAGTGGGAKAAVGERKVKAWKSPMDPTYVRNEPGKDAMGHDLVPVYEDGNGGNTIAIDPVTAQSMGVRTAPVTREDLGREIRAVGRIGFEESKQYMVNSKIGGWIERLYVNQTGQMVKKGEPLLEIYSPELVSAQQEYLLALRNRDELAKSSFAEIGAGGARLVEAARQRLRYWDISAKQIEQLEQTGEVRKTMTLFAPVNGIVTEKKAYQGMSIMPGVDLLQISDISQIWVYADVYEYELPWVKLGQPAIVEIPYAVDKALNGKVNFIYPTVNPETRTVQVRIAFANPGFELKPEMFVNVRLQAETTRGVLAIPTDAILNSGTGQHVFVALGEGKFEPRTVKTGLQGEDGKVQVLSGVAEGEQVVTSAQFMLDSESKLREAIQKMTAPPAATGAAPTPDAQKAKKEMEDLFK
jgi:Cu(I)/Ag(I) efflux system membrane fusion protein/cobalt-zinc-cadmium efflux system membrane fusion protein